MIINDAIREANSDRQICALLLAYMGSLDPDLANYEQNLDCSDINSVRARFRQLIHSLDKVSTCDSDQRPVITQALHVYGEALSRLNALSTAQQQENEIESMPYAAAMLPVSGSTQLAA